MGLGCCWVVREIKGKDHNYILSVARSSLTAKQDSVTKKSTVP